MSTTIMMVMTVAGGNGNDRDNAVIIIIEIMNASMNPSISNLFLLGIRQ